MPLGVMDITNAQYRTTRAADAQCSELLKRLGYKVRYLAARLAIARSLSQTEPPDPPLPDDEDEAAGAIRGQQLFGDGSDPAAWLALITQRSGRTNLSRKDFQGLVSAHWRRGADLLTKDWEEANGSLAAFVTRLADLASLAAGDPDRPHRQGDPDEAATLAAAVVLPVGPVAEDAQTGEPVTFPLNTPGGSPHMAIMGGTNSGKTYTALTMLKRLRSFGSVPILAFDFKGDLSDKLAPDIGAEVVSPPRTPVPLHVLSVQVADEMGLREAAGRIRESIGRVKSSKLSGVQSDALREAVLQTLRARPGSGPATLADVSRALALEYQRRNRKPDELTATLNELTQFTLFTPQMSPAEFFGRSWVIRLPQDGTAEVRRLVINLTLDALDRWLNSQPDSPTVEGRRALRHVCMLDEAHVILATRLPALSNLIRMSRSKGGVIMLVSQSPDDFEGEEDGFLDNMGLTLAFNTQAKAGPTRTIFGAGASLAELAVGEALCRIRTEARTRRLIAWRP
ncbi:DndE family protein [Siccirubricoccus sp. KC 17139]|uniref:DndE family protein n=1 Tax=Siccirubricoccus soli TaxID=2899147 RepID=A0ABT1CZW5_9PROT|nr:DndE family protein [Siccirubricoccus soli]MCO6415211.1 DndE family protein [Siccirubricoccus soli]MCP2681342.1 DndE family protein [Siccirubricoccus soli]